MMLLSPVQESYIDNYVREIISSLPPKAIQELLSGYENDLDRLLSVMREQTCIVTHMDRTLDMEKLEYLANVEKSMDLSLRKQSYNYFKTVCLPTFRQGWRNLEWGNLFQLYLYNCILASRSSGKSFEGCFAFILWRLYSYDRPTTFLRDSIDNKNRKETCMITNNETLGKKHIAMIISEIEQNDILREKLNRNGKAKLAATSITTETDSILHLRSKDSMIRGLHVGAVVCDDLPDESSLYSQEQREKLHEVFYGSITPIVEPFGYLCVLGCVRPDTYVFTENGLTEIGKLSPVNIEREKGFFPLDMNIHDGEGFVNATDYYVNGKTPTKIITLSNGLEIETSFIHPLLRCNSETGLFEWVNAKDLYEGDFVAFKMGSNIWGRSLGIEGEELYEIGLCIWL